MGLLISANKDIERWVAGGLIDRATGDKLTAELANRPGRFGLGAVLGALGAVLLGAAMLSLVAANWEAIPRLFRVALIGTTILGGYLGGAWRAGKGDNVFSGALYLLAAIAFGGGIALVGQMYHLSGDTASAALVWCLATLLASFLLLSGNLAAMAGLIGLFYLLVCITEPSWHSAHYYWVVPPLAAAIAASARLSQTRLGLHSAAWLFLGMFAFIRVDRDFQEMDIIFALLGSALFVIFAYFDDAAERVTQFAHPLQFYALASAFTGFAAWQFEQADNGVTVVVILGLAVLGLAIAALAMKGRDNGGVRALAYLAFGAEVLYLSFVTVGSIIGTSLFFFLIGIFVIFLAFLVVRLEKRFKSQQAGVPS